MEPFITQRGQAASEAGADRSPVVLRPTRPIAVGANDAAKRLGISTRLLWELTRRGEVTPARIGRRVLYPLVELEAFVARSQQQQGGAK